MFSLPRVAEQPFCHLLQAGQHRSSSLTWEVPACPSPHPEQLNLWSSQNLLLGADAEPVSGKGWCSCAEGLRTAAHRICGQSLPHRTLQLSWDHQQHLWDTLGVLLKFRTPVFSTQGEKWCKQKLLASAFFLHPTVPASQELPSLPASLTFFPALWNTNCHSLCSLRQAWLLHQPLWWWPGYEHCVVPSSTAMLTLQGSTAFPRKYRISASCRWAHIQPILFP